jgi:endonuclease/exonuclease/phosphatase family metal-dependent hydrolase
LRIDYVFASQEIEVLDYRTIRADASDHYPVVASVRIKDL